MAIVLEHDASNVYNAKPHLWAECTAGPSRCGYLVHRTVTVEPEPELEKPREWLVHQHDAHGTIICQQNHDDTYRRPFLVHDADQCDRLRGER